MARPSNSTPPPDRPGRISPSPGGARTIPSGPGSPATTSSSGSVPRRAEGDPRFAATWAVLEDAVLHILDRRDTATLSYAESYRHVYTLTCSCPLALYEALWETLARHLDAVAAAVAGATVFLAAVAAAWETHLASLRVLSAVFMYLDNHFAARHNLPSVLGLGIRIFYERVVLPPQLAARLRARLADAAAGHLDAARRMAVAYAASGPVDEPDASVLASNAASNSAAAVPAAAPAAGCAGAPMPKLEGDEPLRSVLMMLATIQTPSDVPNSVYESIFETAFCDAAAAAAGALALELLDARDAASYVRGASCAIEAELGFCRSHLDRVSEPKLLRVLNAQLVTQHLDTVCAMRGGGVAALLDAVPQRPRALAALSALYAFAARVERGPEVLGAVVGRHVTATCRATLEAALSSSQQPPTPATLVAAVEEMMAHRVLHERLLRECFDLDRTVSRHLRAALEAVMNDWSRASEALSLFLHVRLSKGGRTYSDEELDAVFDRAMLLFRLLRDKDVFERYYKAHLARRLLSRRSASTEAERLMISKLKLDCGFQFTSKLEGMFADLRNSEQLTERFVRDCTPAMDLNLYVLTAGFWPLPAAPVCDVGALPPEIAGVVAGFASFYVGQHSGRTLVFHMAMGSADVRARLGGQRYELVVTTPQMLALLLFNTRRRVPVEELARLTVATPDEVRRTVAGLVHARHPVLVYVGGGGDGPEALEVNAQFRSRQFKVKVSVVSGEGAAAAAAASAPTVDRQVLEDRKLQIDSAIVRVMKARRTLSHANLVAEVVRQLAPRFTPSMPMIKKRIESLIEREFLVRAGDDSSSYSFVA